MTRLVLAAAALLAVGAVQKPSPQKPGALTQAQFVNPFAPEELRNKQAVIETSMGTIVLDLLNERAPNHAAHFVQTA